MKNRTGLLAFFIVGGYYAWKNRFQIQRFLESRGVNIPMDTSSLKNSLKSGIAKVTGSTQSVKENIEHEVRRAV